VYRGHEAALQPAERHVECSRGEVDRVGRPGEFGGARSLQHSVNTEKLTDLYAPLSCKWSKSQKSGAGEVRDGAYFVFAVAPLRPTNLALVGAPRKDPKTAASIRSTRNALRPQAPCRNNERIRRRVVSPICAPRKPRTRLRRGQPSQRPTRPL
jgi:hypothetical protein